MKVESSDLLHKISKWIMRFSYLNILWILFTALGLVIFGIFPATISMFSITRKWLQKEDDIPIFKTFWTIYKEELIKGNILGVVIFPISLFLYANYNFILNINSDLFYFFLYPVLVITIFLYSALLYMFPMYVHYRMGIFSILKNTIIIIFVNPLITLGMISSSLILFYILFTLPGLIPFVSCSVLAFLLSYQFNLALTATHQKHTKDKSSII